jgi:hypothetical protein
MLDSYEIEATAARRPELLSGQPVGSVIDSGPNPQARRSAMKVKAEGIDAELGNNGITLHIASPGKNRNKHVGTLGFGRATLKWRKGAL